jgi:hypothetical protein
MARYNGRNFSTHGNLVESGEPITRKLHRPYLSIGHNTQSACEILVKLESGEQPQCNSVQRPALLLTYKGLEGVHWNYNLTRSKSQRKDKPTRFWGAQPGSSAFVLDKAWTAV